LKQIEINTTKSQFKNIEDLRPYFLKHPNQEMVKDSCLHYLGNSVIETSDIQEVIENSLYSENRFNESACTELAIGIIENLKSKATNSQ
jgi:hypothetical protein